MDENPVGIILSEKMHIYRVERAVGKVKTMHVLFLGIRLNTHPMCCHRAELLSLIKF